MNAKVRNNNRQTNNKKNTNIVTILLKTEYDHTKVTPSVIINNVYKEIFNKGCSIKKISENDASHFNVRFTDYTFELHNSQKDLFNTFIQKLDEELRRNEIKNKAQII